MQVLPDYVIATSLWDYQRKLGSLYFHLIDFYSSSKGMSQQKRSKWDAKGNGCHSKDVSKQRDVKASGTSRTEASGSHLQPSVFERRLAPGLRFHINSTTTKACFKPLELNWLEEVTPLHVRIEIWYVMDRESFLHFHWHVSVLPNEACRIL